MKTAAGAMLFAALAIAVCALAVTAISATNYAWKECHAAMRDCTASVVMGSLAWAMLLVIAACVVAAITEKS